MGVNQALDWSHISLLDSGTPILGRDQDAASLEALLADDTVRLITITGPGGVGKTRLATHVAARIGRRTSRRVAFVPLAPIRDPSLVLLAIGLAFGLVTDSPDDYEHRLIDHLQKVDALLVLDNLEQVLDVAPALARLLQECAAIRILATSQAPLGIRGEQLFPLLPLTTHDTADTSIDDLRRSDAVTLFVQRATAIDPRFCPDAETTVAIASICRRLDGLPLAIELAAARTNLMSPANLLARLDDQLRVLGQHRVDIPDRFRTMRAAVAWSYDLLDPAEQAMFRRLSVYLGGFSEDVTEATCALLDDRSGLGMLGALVDRSLIQQTTLASGAARFLMLEPIREFGINRLRHQGEEDTAREAHAAFLARFVEEADPELVGSHQLEWFARVDVEMENIRTAIAWSLAHDRAENVLRICNALSVYLRNRGLSVEAGAWLAAALHGRETGASPHRTKGLVTAGSLAETRRDMVAAVSFFTQARHLAAATGDVKEEIRALYGLGTIAKEQADMPGAMELYAQGVQRSLESNDRRGLLYGYDNLAVASYFQGRYEDTAMYYGKALPLVSEFADVSAQAVAFGNLGAIYHLLGRVDESLPNIRRAIALHREVGNQRDLPRALNNLGMILIEQGEWEQAREALREAITIHQSAGDPVSQAVAVHSLSILTLAEGNPPGAATLLLECMELLATQEMPYRFLEIADLLADIAFAHGDHAAGVELLGACDRLRHAHSIEVATIGQPARKENVANAREALGESSFASHWEQGEAMDLARLKVRIPIIARTIVGQRFTALIIPDVESGDVPEPSARPYGLTGREFQVLRMLVAGKTTVELAADLAISPRTAATHISNIMAKMGAKSRTAAVALAMRDGVA